MEPDSPELIIIAQYVDLLTAIARTVVCMGRTLWTIQLSGSVSSQS